MPQLLIPAITALGTAIGGAFGAGLIMYSGAIASGLVFGSTLVYGAVQQRRMEKKARAQRNGDVDDRLVSLIASDAPWRIVYGEAVVGGVIPAMLTSGDKDQYKHVPMIWAAHECQSIEAILVKGVDIGALDGSGNVTGGKWFKAETRGHSQLVNFNGSGAATLTYAPTSVQRVWQSFEFGDGEGRQTITDVLLDGSSLAISGNTITHISLAGVTAWVSYVYASGGDARLRVHHHLGSASQTADATLLAELPADWSSSDRLRGLCYSVLRYGLDEPEFQGGPVQVTARVRGCKVYDPRKDSTNGGSGAHRLNNTATWEYNNNSALCTAHFLMAEWGKQALSAQIDWASVAAAANACDEVLPNGQKRFTCNGSFTTEQDTDQTLTELCQSMAGFAVYSGVWTLQAGVYTAPVMALTDADNMGSVEVLAAPAGMEVFNGLRGRFYDPARFDQVTDYEPYANAAFVAEDGKALWDDLPLPFTNAAWRCTNLARIQVERSRGMQLVYPAKNRARALRVGQRVTLTCATLGLSNDVFRVAKKEHRIGDPVKLTLVQDAASMYDLADAPASLDSPSNFGVDPFEVDPVAGLDVISDVNVAQWSPDGSLLVNVMVTWTASTDALVLTHGAIQVEYREGAATAWKRVPEAPGSSTSLVLPRLPDKRVYTVRARWRNGLGATSDWRYDSVLTAELPSLRGGGGNLLRNSSFEVDSNGDGVPDYWTGVSIGTGLTVTPSQSTNATHGRWSFRMQLGSISAPTSQATHQYFQTLDAAILPKVQPGKRYVVSAEFLPGHLDYSARSSVYWYDASMTLIPGASYNKNTPLTSTADWTRVWSSALTAPANAAFARVGLGLARPSVNSTTSTSMRIDAAIFMAADLAAQYWPADAATGDLLPGSAVAVAVLADPSETGTFTSQSSATGISMCQNTVWENDSERTVTIFIEASAEASISVASGAGPVAAGLRLGFILDAGVTVPFELLSGDVARINATTSSGTLKVPFSVSFFATVPPGESVGFWIIYECDPGGVAHTWTQTAKGSVVRILALKTA